MNASKSKQVGIRAHNAIGRGLSAIGRGIKKGAVVTYDKALKPAGHGIKTGVVSVKDFGAGLVLGERDIAAEQKKLAEERIARFQARGAVLDPKSKLYIFLSRED